MLRGYLLTIGMVLCLASGCGSSDTAPSAVPEPTPEAAPAPAPEPTPEPTPEVELGQVTLHRIVLEEIVEPPNFPSTSPFHREILVPVPSAGPDVDFLRGDAASRVAIESLQTLEAGYGRPGTDLALVEWTMRWGEDTRGGQVRRWGLCSLPCTVEDRFVGTARHHPVDPVEAPRALFAMRPGARNVSIRVVGEQLEVLHEDTVLWSQGKPGEAAEGESADEIQTLEADGLTTDTLSALWKRSLRVLATEVRSYPLVGTSELLPDTVRLFPRLGPKPATPRLRAVEGVEEVWDWPGASAFEGGFTAKPNPAEDGLKLERVARRVRWFPTVRQAGEGEIAFGVYSLSRGDTRATLTPFPDGAAVLGGTAALDGRLIVASGTDFEEGSRAEEVAGMLGAFQEKLPLPDPTEDRPAPWILYTSSQPAGVLRGGAGPRPASFSVSDVRGEQLSVARVWARLLLGPNLVSTGPAAQDFIDWVLAQVLEGHPDRSVLTSTFLAAGEDVDSAWRQWLVDPEHRGSPDPQGFLDFVAGQLPELAEQLRRDLTARSFLAGPMPQPMDFEPGEDRIDLDLEERGIVGHVVTARLPPGASLLPVQVRVTPKRAGNPVHWAAVLVEERYWEESGIDDLAREELAGRLSATQGVAEEPEEEESLAAPSARQLPSQLAGARVRTRPSRAAPTELTLQHQGKPVGDSVVLITVWGAPGWQAEIDIVSSVAAPELLAQEEASGQTEAPDGEEPTDSNAPPTAEPVEE